MGNLRSSVVVYSVDGVSVKNDGERFLVTGNRKPLVPKLLPPAPDFGLDAAKQIGAAVIQRNRFWRTETQPTAAVEIRDYD
jgi:hypothetical protein